MRNIVLFLLMTCFAHPVFAAEPNGRDIMLSVDAVDVSEDSSMYSQMVIERGAMKLVRKLEMLKLCDAENPKDDKSLIRFIEPADGGKDLFVHMSSILMDGFKTLKDGQSVEYEVGESDRGPVAKNVVPK